MSSSTNQIVAFAFSILVEFYEKAFSVGPSSELASVSFDERLLELKLKKFREMHGF